MKMNWLDWLTAVLVVVGAVNWGLVGLLDFDLVAAILGDMSTISRVVYSLVGVSGLYMIYSMGTKSMAKD